MAPEIAVKTRAKNGSPVGPCCDCGTRFGHVGPGKVKPIRVSGTRFGIDGQLCAGCYEKHNAREQREARVAKDDEAQRIAAESQALDACTPISFRERIRLDARRLSLVIQGRIAS